jgi:hypothetical protein
VSRPLGWSDAAELAAHGVARRPGRAVLTVLAVTLAATLLVALLTIVGTARSRVLTQLSKGGALSGIRVVAADADPDQLDLDNPRSGAPRDLSESTITQLRRVTGVRTVVPIAQAVMEVRPLGTLADRAEASLRSARRRGAGSPPQPLQVALGFDLNRASLLPLTIVAGRLPVPSSTTEVAITPGALTRLGLTKADAPSVIGAEVEVGAPRLRDGVSVQWRRFRIVGVVAQDIVGSAQVLFSIDRVQEAKAWTALGNPLPNQPTSPYAGAFVEARTVDDVATVRRAITDIGYSTSAPENLVATVRRYLRVIEIVLSGIGTIALVIAALGIANAMLAAVRERRREIGVLKAIGANDGDILRLFLVEAAVLGLIGGVLGTLAGWGVATIVAQVVNRYLRDQGLAGVALQLPAWIAAFGIGGSLGLSVLAGTVPALRASRLPAREAVGS